jgi:hypothetical protein
MQILPNGLRVHLFSVACRIHNDLLQEHLLLFAVSERISRERIILIVMLRKKNQRICYQNVTIFHVFYITMLHKMKILDGDSCEIIKIFLLLKLLRIMMFNGVMK